MELKKQVMSFNRTSTGLSLGMKILNFKFDPYEGPIAQWLEQRTHNPLVRGSNPCGPTHVSPIVLVFTIAIINLQGQGLRSLELPHALQFGMDSPELQTVMDAAGDSAVTVTERDRYQILLVKILREKRTDRPSQIRAFVSREKGLFAVEEEIFLKWDHQQEEKNNLESHRRAMDAVLTRLREKHGRESLLEDTPFGKQYIRFQHVTATWRFTDNGWIHLIYEPQDWALYPELVKIVVIYRSESFDPRESQSVESDNSLRSSNR